MGTPDDLLRHFLRRVGVRAPLAWPPLCMRALSLAIRLQQDSRQLDDRHQPTPTVVFDMEGRDMLDQHTTGDTLCCSALHTTPLT